MIFQSWVGNCRFLAKKPRNFEFFEKNLVHHYDAMDIRKSTYNNFFVEQTIWLGEGKHDSAINRGQKMGYPS